MLGRNGGPDLEGRLVLIAGDSNNSRKFRNDIAKHLRQDHQFSTRILRLDSHIIDYSNDELNFSIESPYDNLKPEQVDEMLRSADTYIVSKLENPELQNPLNYHLDQFFEDVGTKYVQLANTNGLTPDKVRERFFNYMAVNIGKTLTNVMSDSVLERDLWDITDKLFGWCQMFEEPLTHMVKGEEKGKETLDVFKYAVKGFLTDYVQQRPKIIALEELRSLSDEIGIHKIGQEDFGRISWVTPFLDGRSDHNRGNPREGIRLRELADYAKMCNIYKVKMVRAHSHTGMEFFTDKGIEVDNLTLTNEYISMLAQQIDNFEDTLVITPDEGGLADAMVYAREMHRRTKGEFSGRVVMLKKRRQGIGEIKDMEFMASFKYDATKDPEADIADKEGNPLPYDHFKTHAKHYKDKNHEHYIGNLFNLEFGALDYITSGDEEEGEIEKRILEITEKRVADKSVLKRIINTHTSFLRDDLIASGGTMITAAKYMAKEFASDSIAMIEHPCLTGDAMQKLSDAYNEGYLSAVLTSSSIMHPNISGRPWHDERPLSRRFTTGIRRDYAEFVETNLPTFHERLQRFDAKGTETLAD